MGDGRRTGGGGASSPCPNEAADGWGCASAPAWGWEMGGGRMGGGMVGLDGLNQLGLESGVIWSF